MASIHPATSMTVMMRTMTSLALVGERSRPQGELTSSPSTDRRGRLGLLVLLTVAAIFWSVTLYRNGWANPFYSAAVQAGTKSWKAFLFGSSDAGNSITVDKPPASLWPMEISARIFGVNTWSIQLPQVLFGLASVALLYVIVKRQFGVAAGLIAGGVLAVTPVATLMFRYNNPDALLVFVMIAAVWALLRAVDDGRARWLVLCGALVGLGFLTKQMQVMLIAPGLAATYLIAGPARLRVRLAQLGAGIAAVLAAAGWWVLLVSIIPASDRPYVGGSTDNSFMSLTFGYNGIARLSGQGFPPLGFPPSGAPAGLPKPSGGLPPFGSHAGLMRLFTAESGAQIAWLLPAALVLLVVGILLCARAPRTDACRAQYLAWGGWLLVSAAVFSFMSGIFHDYYTVALAPAVAALIGIGVVELWRARTSFAGAVLGASVAGTAVWAWVLLGRTPQFVPALRWGIVVTGVIAAVGLLLERKLPAVVGRRAQRVIWVAAALAALAGPLSYSIQTISKAQTGPIITAGPTLKGNALPPAPPGNVINAAGPIPQPMGQPTVSDRVIQLLSQNADSYTWVAATNGALSAAPYQLATGDTVMPIGGFSSGDPSPTLEQFQRDVAAHLIHYYIQSSMPAASGGQTGGAQPPHQPTQADHIADWVQHHFTATTVDGVTLYDLTAPTA